MTIDTYYENEFSIKKKIISEIKLLLDIFKFNDDNLKFWKDDWEVCHSSVIKQFPMEET